MSIIIVEGIDNVGKGTFIKTLMNAFGFWQVIKYDRPLKLDCFKRDDIDQLRTFQECSYENGFNLLLAAANKGVDLIFDRFHLGEVVYSPFYRGYSGDYVFDIEQRTLQKDVMNKINSSVSLILLHAERPDKLPDDGKSFDVSKCAAEQAMFVDAFSRSKLRRKKLIQVQESDGTFRNPNEIVAEFSF